MDKFRELTYFWMVLFFKKIKMASSASNIQKKTDLESIMEGISRLDTPALEVIAQKVNNLVAQRKEKRTSKREPELIKKITGGGPALDLQVRFKELAQKLVDEKITGEEHQELLTIIQKNEAWAVERLQYLIELSHLRNCSVAVIMKQLASSLRRLSSRLFIMIDKNKIVTRAGGRCEYCKYPANYSAAPFVLEHIIPLAAGGETSEENLAYSCQGCNGHKYTKTIDVDPFTG